MTRVKVFKFKGWDQQGGGYVIAHLKRTAASIDRLHAPTEIIPGTEEEVDEKDLDEEGRYDPSKKRSPQ